MKIMNYCFFSILAFTIFCINLTWAEWSWTSCVTNKTNRTVTYDYSCGGGGNRFKQGKISAGETKWFSCGEEVSIILKSPSARVGGQHSSQRRWTLDTYRSNNSNCSSAHKYHIVEKNGLPSIADAEWSWTSCVTNKTNRTVTYDYSCGGGGNRFKQGKISAGETKWFSCGEEVSIILKSPSARVGGQHSSQRRWALDTYKSNNSKCSSAHKYHIVEKNGLPSIVDAEW